MIRGRVSSAAALVVLLAYLAASGARQSGDAAHTPKPGSAERKAIMDTLRAPVERELQKQVIFKVDHLKVQGDAAFMRGVPRRPDGGPMDYNGTQYERSKREGVFDDWICALFRKKGTKWTVVIFVIGATDVVYDGWDREYRAPPSIFK